MNPLVRDILSFLREHAIVKKVRIVSGEALETTTTILCFRRIHDLVLTQLLHSEAAQHGMRKIP